MMTENVNQKIRDLLKEQTQNWPLARTNYEGLKTVQTRVFSFGDYNVKVQFNPARIVSSGAKVDAKTIAERKCFLCAENRPTEQTSVNFGDYEILVNPFPIFPEHFTIAHKKHQPQQILPFFADMLWLALAMDDYLVFYNGPQCGASAPDHLHFQGGTKDFLPLVNDYKRQKSKNAQLITENNNTQIFQLKNYGRTVFVIESTDIEGAENAFKILSQTLGNLSRLREGEGIGGEDVHSFLRTLSLEKAAPLSINSNSFSPLTWERVSEGRERWRGVRGEVMMNVVCTVEFNKWNVFVLPRKAFRPWQYTVEGDEQLLVSPATVEMCGVFITPLEAHFNKISKEDIESIFNQVSL